MFSEPARRRGPHDHHSNSVLGLILGRGSSIKPLLPSLKALYLLHMSIPQQDLARFLSMHTSSLRLLCLGGIILTQRHNTQDGKACWVEFIKFLKSNLTLSSVEFVGWLSNGGRQKWFVTHNPAGSHRLRASVRRYIVDPGDRVCPLDCVAIQPGQEDVSKPPPGADEIRGDWTWTMTYPLHKQRHLPEQLFSGDDLFRTATPPAKTSVCSKKSRASTGTPFSTASSSWPSSCNQPPQKKLKSSHWPVDVQSPASTWSSPGTESSGSSFHESLAGDVSNTLSSAMPASFASKAKHDAHHLPPILAPPHNEHTSPLYYGTTSLPPLSSKLGGWTAHDQAYKPAVGSSKAANISFGSWTSNPNFSIPDLDDAWAHEWASVPQNSKNNGGHWTYESSASSSKDSSKQDSEFVWQPPKTALAPFSFGSASQSTSSLGSSKHSESQWGTYSPGLWLSAGTAEFSATSNGQPSQSAPSQAASLGGWDYTVPTAVNAQVSPQAYNFGDWFKAQLPKKDSPKDPPHSTGSLDSQSKGKHVGTG